MSFSSPPTYRGFPVLDVLPDWSDPSLKLDFRQAKSRLDGGAGPLRDDSPYQRRPRTARRLRYLLETRAEMLAARTFLKTVAQGRRNGFWVPAWTQDLLLAAVADSGDTTIAVTRIGFARFYPVLDSAEDARLGRQHLALFPHQEGAGPLLVARKITGAATVGETDVLTIDSGVGHVVSINDLLSFLLFCRLDEDRVLLQWETFESGVLELSLIDLPRETP
jgi:hypothetical protein